MDDEAWPYQVLAPIEQDAQGITYLAERSAGRVRGFVALTVVVGGNGEAILSRFHALKPALARLQHPGASKVLDAGSTPDGSVYVASEYVAGPTLSEMASRQPLERAERAEVARQLTEAVGAAHAAGVLHLDLDGSKVRVSTAGGLRAWITGFGVSVIVAGRAGSPDTDLVALDTLIRQLDL
jgi:serine/threonine-protein kinase